MHQKIEKFHENIDRSFIEKQSIHGLRLLLGKLYETLMTHDPLIAIFVSNSIERQSVFRTYALTHMLKLFIRKYISIANKTK